MCVIQDPSVKRGKVTALHGMASVFFSKADISELSCFLEVSFSPHWFSRFLTLDTLETFEAENLVASFLYIGLDLHCVVVSQPTMHP